MQSCLIYLAGVVALGLAAQWLAWRLRLPAILLLLAFGFLFGLMGGEATDPELLIGSPLLFPAGDVQLERAERLVPQQAGRILFDSDATFGRLSGRLASGAVVKKTRLSEEFDYNAFGNLYGESAVALFVIDESGKLIVRTTESTADPRPGQTLISLVEPIESDATTPRSQIA